IAAKYRVQCAAISTPRTGTAGGGGRRRSRRVSARTPPISSALSTHRVHTIVTAGRWISRTTTAISPQLNAQPAIRRDPAVWRRIRTTLEAVRRLVLLALAAALVAASPAQARVSFND